MAEVNTTDQPNCALPTKRKPDLTSEEDDPTKKLKVGNSESNASPPTNPSSEDDLNKDQKVPISENSAPPSKDRSFLQDLSNKGKYETLDVAASASGGQRSGVCALWDVDNEEDDEEYYEGQDDDEEEDDEEDEDDEEEDEEDDDDDDDDDDDEEGVDGERSSGKSAEVDRKGKGIMNLDKGKGKLVAEQSEDDDSSDDDGDDDVIQPDADDVDDPLDEVDLNNILPSRTRRRAPQRGFYIGSSPRNAGDRSKGQ